MIKQFTWESPITNIIPLSLGVVLIITANEVVHYNIQDCQKLGTAKVARVKYAVPSPDKCYVALLAKRGTLPSVPQRLT